MNHRTRSEALASIAEEWLLDSLTDGVILLDERRCVVYVNRAAEALLGLAGPTASAVDPERLGLPAPWLTALSDAMREHASCRLPEARVETPTSVHYLEGEGHPSPAGGLAVVFHDITDRKRDEEVLRVRDRALDASPNGIILTDATRSDNPIVYANPAFLKITGYSAEEVIGRNCRFLQRDDRSQPALDELRRALQEGRSCTVTLRNYRKDGTLFWNELSVAPVQTESGEITHFVGIQQDVTDRKRAQDALVERNAELKAARDQLEIRNLELRGATQSKDRFMATMSHEMRTPLNAILGYAELLRIGIAGELSDVQRTHLERVAASGRALLDLINDVLDFTRAESGRLSIDRRSLQLPAVAEEAVELVRTHAESKALTLRIEPPDFAVPPVSGDFRRLRQILTNLLTNAVKFTHQGSIVVSFAQPEDGRVAVHIRDTGIGIAEEEHQRIFGEFYQADSDLTREYGGTGLGLAISQRLAHMMGGEITVSSAPGHGSTFSLTLPAADTAADEATGSADPTAEFGAAVEAAEQTDDGPVTVVIFGSDQDALRALEESLRPRVRVVTTTSPGSVTELARSEGAALIVLDVACEAGAGWEAAHAVREDADLDDIAVLLLPCLPSGAPLGALDLGWVAVVPKPFNSAQLKQMVERAATEYTDGRRSDGAELDVLVVDDDPDTREIAARILTSANVTVRTAQDGEAGLAEMRRAVPDIAVLDLMMPVLDGFGVLAAMRADPMLQQVPVVVLTAKDLSAAERQFLARTAESVLLKGVHTLADVATLVLRAAERQPA